MEISEIDKFLSQSNAKLTSFTGINQRDLSENKNGNINGNGNINVNIFNKKDKTDSFQRQRHSLDTRFFSVFDMIEEDKAENQVKMLAAKIRSGKTLTNKELMFLKKYAPDLYELAMRIQAEVKSFEEQLKKCDSKEEVEMLMLIITLRSIAKIQKADKSGNDIESAVEMALLNALNEAYEKFKESDKFKDLREEMNVKCS